MGWSRAIAVGVLVLAGPAAGQRDDATLARGRYIVEVAAACGVCHNGRDAAGRPVTGAALAGGWVLGESEGRFRAVVPNITPDVATGIGAWSDAEIGAALRQGRHRDGHPIGPPMPVELYRQLTDADITAIVAYLRTVPAVIHAVTAKSTYPFVVTPVVSVSPVAPPADTPVARGAYLAGPLAHCTHCHTPISRNEQRDWSRIGAGGVAFTGPWGAAVSANITSDRAAGIGGWSDARLIAELTTGVDPDGRTLAPPMAARAAMWAQLTPRDMTDLIAYLRTLPPQP